jgi:hypothetical protein
MAAVFREESNRLNHYKVTGPAAPIQPWNLLKVEKQKIILDKSKAP